MNNKVETLRSILFTKEDLETIKDIKGVYSDEEIELMIEFKKIYELGTDQLKKFIDLLDSKGKDVDEYTILYYMEVLLNGPLGAYTREFTKDKKKYWPSTPDTLGNNGNNNSSSTNIVMYSGVGYPLGCSVDTFNKIPGFIQTTLESAIKTTEDLFRDSMESSTMFDNTLPIIDKSQQIRYFDEPEGEWVKKSHGTQLVKDRTIPLALRNIATDIFDKVKDYLEEDETNRLYKAKKQYSAFDSRKNEATSTNVKLEKEFIDGDNKELIVLDVLGDEFDSTDKRSSVLKISNPIKDEEFKLHTNEGQLGN